MSVRPAGDFKTSYVQDMAILDTRSYRLGFAVLVAEYALIRAAGGLGSTPVPPIVIGGWTVRTDRQFYYIVLVVWLAAGAFAANLVRSRIGLAFMAVRDRDYAAQVLGLDLLYYKALAFGIAAGSAGIAGSLWAHYNRLIPTEQFKIGAYT